VRRISVTLALTLTLSPKEREKAANGLSELAARATAALALGRTLGTPRRE